MADALPRPTEQRLRAAVESAPSGLLMTDGAGRIVLVNREIERLFGYAREELLGQPVDLLIPTQVRDRHPAFRAAFMAAPTIRAMGAGRDLFGRRRDGTEVPVEIGLTPVVTEEGMFVLASIVDISARKRLEQRFRAMVESSPNGTIMVDADGNIVLVNREVERLFGYTRDELLGLPVEYLVPHRFRRQHPAFRGRFGAEPTQRAMGAGRELFGLRKDGTEIPVEIGLNPMTTDEGLFVLAAVVDISARKQAEEERQRLADQLQQAQKLEALGTLAGGIAHDFNNVLGAIVGYAELAQARTQDAASRADLTELLKAAGHGRQIIERILRFSRRQAAERVPLVLGGPVREAVALLRSTLPASVDLRLDVASDLPTVLADATAIHQVIVNLATNAAHAMAGGGRLDIAVESWYARDSVVSLHPELHEGQYARIVVRDTGSGMTPEVMARAFEPFFTTKAAGAGSGLGLAMVRGLVRDHGGATVLESRPGEGTTVTCYFPADLAEPAAPAEPFGGSVARGAGQCVMFVDDQPALADVGARRLEAMGYAAVAFTDPAAALAALTTDPARWDAVITDYSMPGLSGLELARAVTALRPGMPVLLLTGWREDISDERMGAAGVRRVLLKPVAGGDLAAALEELLGGQREAK